MDEILYEINGEKTIDGLLEDLDCKAEEILMSIDIDEEDVFKLANMVQDLYNVMRPEA